MQTATEENLSECLHRIEIKLGWGKSAAWSNNDFEILSEEILDDTGVCLSITTLKRIWGRVHYNSKPAVTTLNALAQFAGCKTWREFSQNHASINENEIIQIKNDVPGLPGQKKTIFYPLLISGIILLVGFIIYSSFRSTENTGKISFTGYRFSSKKTVSEGIPNSVIFNYDASHASPADSVFIQQSWDKRLSQQVSRNEHLHTSIYYYPGFFKAKLVVNNETVKEHNLFIQTSGWVGIEESKPVPVYFKEAQLQQRGMIRLPLQLLKENNILLQPETPWIGYYNVREFDSIKTDNFIFETEVRNDYQDGGATCGNCKITILTEGSAINLPLCVNGCVSDLKLFFIDSLFDGKTDDLSAFGCNTFDWVKVRCEVKNKIATILINNRPVFSTGFASAATKITGVILRFQGTGSVRVVKLSKLDGQIVYEDKFN